jgi:hypothetical protein
MPAEGFKPMVQNVQPLRSVQPPGRGSVKNVLNGLNDLNDLNGSEATSALKVWRRRADSNRCIEVLQTSPLTTWVRRRQLDR